MNFTNDLPSLLSNEQKLALENLMGLSLEEILIVMWSYEELVIQDKHGFTDLFARILVSKLPEGKQILFHINRLKLLRVICQNGGIYFKFNDITRESDAIKTLHNRSYTATEKWDTFVAVLTNIYRCNVAEQVETQLQDSELITTQVGDP